jgi:hypothetical protein
MNDTKYIGLDVHQATISAVVLDSSGNLVMESILETKAATILQFVHGLRGSLHITFEKGPVPRARTLQPHPHGCETRRSRRYRESAKTSNFWSKCEPKRAPNRGWQFRRWR